MFNSLSTLFIANNCYSCNQVLTSQEEAVCLKCIDQIEQTYFHLTPQANELYYRLAGQVPIDGAGSLFYFDKKGIVQGLIQQLKYDDAPQLGVALGSLYAKKLRGSPLIQSVDTLVPVPLHWKKKIKRGYNQAYYIAKGMSEVLHLPVETRIVTRVFATRTQTKLSGEARWQNVQTAFYSKSPITLPKGVLLVDDIITTGATLEACIRSLLNVLPTSTPINVASIGMARKA